MSDADHKVGDTISVNIPDASKLDPNNFSAGLPMTLPGTIIEDLGQEWLVKLDMKVGGKVHSVRVPK